MRLISILTLYFIFPFVFLDYDFETDKDDEETFEIGSMQLFDQGNFIMGSIDNTYEIKGEHPIRREYAKPFMLDRYPVTNADFANFVKEKRYYTTQPDLNKFSYVYFRHFKSDFGRYDKKYLASHTWLIPTLAARWDKPHGTFMDIMTRPLHPVVHVSMSDALAYCQHLNKRLPNEYEWELAARGNNFTWDFPWGFGMRRNRMNIFQGLFPTHDHGYDGFKDISPVNAFQAQNKFGMFDMLGNVWEWTTTQYLGRDLPYDANRREYVTIKGGSFLDTLDGRNGTMPVRCSIKLARPYYYTAENLGFRCAKTVIPEKKKKRLIKYEETADYRRKVEQLSKKFIQLKQKIQYESVKLINKTDEHKHVLTRIEL